MFYHMNNIFHGQPACNYSEFLENFGADSGIVCVLKVVPYNFIFEVVKTGWVGSVEI